MSAILDRHKGGMDFMVYAVIGRYFSACDPQVAVQNTKNVYIKLLTHSYEVCVCFYCIVLKWDRSMAS